MINDNDIKIFETIANKLDQSYVDMIGVNRIDKDNLPREREIISITNKLLELIFPGFGYDTTFKNGFPDGHVDVSLKLVYDELIIQVKRAITFAHKKNALCNEECRNLRSREAVMLLFESLPKIREAMKCDVAAAYGGDPAATSYDEIILSYPGLKAVTIQRLAHELYIAEVPLIPRMMTEHAHSATGIDIHPGAKLGAGLFIDHGSGVVIGETAELGENVKIYQGVTLGAGNFPKDACGMIIKGKKRHPSIGNNVTIYSGASVLGDVTIGDNSVIGGNVWLAESIEAGTKIIARPPEHTRKLRK